MSDGRSSGEPLRRALAGARLRDIDVAKTLGVDPKTVQRWLGGRVPQPRHRWGLADLLSLHEYDLWPHLAGVPSIGPEVYATYPHRGSVPRDVWRQLYHSAEQQIDILVYSGLFLAEDVEMIRLLGDKAQAGIAVRIILGDPDSPHVSQRGDDEGIHGAMAAKIETPSCSTDHSSPPACRSAFTPRCSTTRSTARVTRCSSTSTSTASPPHTRQSCTCAATAMTTYSAPTPPASNACGPPPSR